jgi:hypothetical protein
VVYAAAYQIVGTLPFLVLFQVGFLYTGFLSLFQGRAWGLPPLATGKVKA